MKVLLIEDDVKNANLIKRSLTAQRYLVEVAVDGPSGWELATAFEYNLILLELNLPQLNGISFCQRLRRESNSYFQSLNRNTPVLLIAAENADLNPVAGLDAGADDYIVKPFDLDELLARVRALLRRGSIARSPFLSWGELKIDPRACQASYQGHSFHLSSKEYSLLELLLRYPQRIFSHGALIEHLWTIEDSPTENAVRAQIKGLRRRLKEIGVEDCIETVYGLGYRLKAIHEREVEKPKGREKLEPPPDLAAVDKLKINAIWQQSRQHYCDRLTVIEQTVSALQTHTCTDQLLQQAQREAHTLKGSLGFFELNQATDLAEEIELFLEAASLDPNQVADLWNLTIHLRQILEQPLPEGTLPPTASHSPPTASHSPQAAGHDRWRSQMGAQTPKLLIVDDDVHLLHLLQEMLQPWGFEVILLSDPLQFWYQLEQVQPDLLMLDIKMPGINGIDLCQMIRNDPQWGDLPVLILSVDTEDETIQRVFLTGADDYVRKPIRAAELVARVIRRLEHAAVLKKLRDLEARQC